MERAVRLCGGDEITSGSPCTCPFNLSKALVERHRLLDPRRPFRVGGRHRRGFLSQLRELYRLIRKVNRGVPIPTREEVIRGYSGSKRRHYERCNVELVAYGYIHRCVFPAHVKWGENNIRPRAIVPQAAVCIGVQVGGEQVTRSGEALLIPVLVENPVRKWTEHALCCLRNPDGSRQFACGRSLDQRARDIIKMFPSGWVCYSIDCSSYDGSQGDLAVLEREECQRAVAGYEHIADLRRVLKQQNNINLKCGSSYDGVKASIYGNRASGTAGTSVANKIVMMAALKYACSVSYYSGDVKFYCDGDDTLIFVSERSRVFMEGRMVDGQFKQGSWLRRLAALGLDVKVENIAREPEEVVFCRSKIVRSDAGPVLVKLPHDALRKMCAVMRHFKGTLVQDYFTTMNDGYTRMWNGIPVNGAMGSIFGKGGRTRAQLLGADETFRFGGRVSEVTHIEPSMAARASYFYAFGISQDAQKELELLFKSIGRLMPVLVAEYVRARQKHVIIHDPVVY